MKRLRIENECLSVEVLPELGGKIASIIEKKSGYELLWQSKNGYKKAQYGSDFSLYDTSGIDEMFPTIDRCFYPLKKNKLLPDHGELWSQEWQMNLKNEIIKGMCAGVAMGYEFHRAIYLEMNSLIMEYEVINNEKNDIVCLWALHPLFACDSESRLILPGVNRIIAVQDSNRYGNFGDSKNYPITKDGLNLSLIKRSDFNQTAKFYVDHPLTKGEAGLTVNNNSLVVMVKFDLSSQSYLGVWINEGGFKGEYNVAIEPASGYYDSLETAFHNKKCMVIDSGERKKWRIEITIEENK